MCNFAFRSFSNIEHLLHHTEPKHSYTPLDISNLSNIHTHNRYALRNLLQLSQDNSGQQQTPSDTKRHLQTPKKAVGGCVAVQVDIKWRLLVSFGVWWCPIVSHIVWRWKEHVWGVSQKASESCLLACVRFRYIWGCFWVFRPCMVKHMLYIGKASKGKIPHTWHFWNIKIPKPPYISPLKIIGF